MIRWDRINRMDWYTAFYAVQALCVRYPEIADDNTNPNFEEFLKICIKLGKGLTNLKSGEGVPCYKKNAVRLREVQYNRNHPNLTEGTSK